MWASLASMWLEASWSVLLGSGLGPPSVGGCSPSVVGICELCGGSRGHVVDTSEGACAPGLGCLLPSSSICPKVPKSLSVFQLSLIPRLPSCNGPAVGDVWTPSDIAVCFSCLCSPGALRCGRHALRGSILSLEVALGQGNPLPLGAPSPLQCFWALDCGT